MKITWNKNPLCTVIELDEFEKKELWYKIKIKEMEDLMYDAYFTLAHHEWHNANISKSKPRSHEETMNEAIKELNPEYWLNEENGKTKLDERVDTLLRYYIDALQEKHAGDCTCSPCSCLKCHAENLIDVRTIKGIKKTQAYRIAAAFGQNNERTMDEALRYLHNVPDMEAYNWLLNYRQAHPELTGCIDSEQK